MEGLTIADDLRNSIEHKGGFTYSPFVETPVKGYMVGKRKVREMISNDFTLDPETLAEIWDMLRHDHELFLGGWKDPETGHVFYDISEHFSDLETALEFALKRNELAIYNLETGESIPV
jgi:hypothetical protein